MNGLKRSVILVMVAVTTTLCAACSSAGNTYQPTSDTSYTVAFTTFGTSPRSNTTSTVAVADDYSNGYEYISSFRPGVWLAKNVQTEEERFFIFTDDTHGKVISQQNGAELPFSCEKSEEGLAFQLGADQLAGVKAYWSDDNNAVLRWSADKAESITFLRENSNEPFRFFNNDQLSAMALNYFTASTGIHAEHTRAFINMDETISIQLFDGEGDAQSTYDWYTVDRYTGEGFNATNEVIRLTEAPTGAAAAQTTAAAQSAATQTTTTVQTTTAPQTTPVPQTTPAPQTTPVPPETTAPPAAAEPNPAPAEENASPEETPVEEVPSDAAAEEWIP